MKRLCAWQFGLALIMPLVLAGCRTIDHHPPMQPVLVVPPQSNVPRELAKVMMPRYVVEPPDILIIDAIRSIPKSPYLLRATDVLNIRVRNAIPDAPIDGQYALDLRGYVDFGAPYGALELGGLTVEQANDAVQKLMLKTLVDPVTSVSLASFGGTQQISGQHIVGPDGTVTLGTFGSVVVAGLTLDQVREAVERHLSQFLDSPEVSVNVFAYNSKVYYIVTQGGGLGDNVVRVPVTGNETVLDAISQVNGLQSVSSKRIWIARPVPGCEENIVLPVDWCAVTGRGAAATNYQILPGDRVFIAEDEVVALDNHLAKWISPVERVFGVTLLGTSTARQIKFFNQAGGAGGGFGF
ncbi:MAG: polysaccharide biosynthesis/export family protein [Pirellulales bacterium]